MRELKVPGIYRHFKGNYYAVMGESIRSTEIPVDCDILEGFHTELGKLVKIYKRDNEYYHMEDIDGQNLVLYKTLYDHSGLFIRPKDMFLSEVDRNKYPNIGQKYRFEEK